MTELYWITTLGHLSIALIVLLVAAAAVAIFSSFAYNTTYEEEEQKLYGKCIKISGITFILSLLAFCFTPSTKELYLIYGVGSTIDYLQESPEAKKIPEKTLKALNAWCDEFTNDDKKEE